MSINPAVQLLRKQTALQSRLPPQCGFKPLGKVIPASLKVCLFVLLREASKNQPGITISTGKNAHGEKGELRVQFSRVIKSEQHAFLWVALQDFAMQEGRAGRIWWLSDTQCNAVP